MSNNSEAEKRSRNKRKERMIEAMGGKCTICGYTNSASLVFHHIDPKFKKLSFSTVRSENTAWSLIVEELRKCTILCANCHNEAHFYGLDNYEFKSSFNEDFADIQTTDKGHLQHPEDVRKCKVCNKILNNNQLHCCSEFCRIGWSKKTKSKIDWDLELPKIHNLRLEGYTYVDIAQLYPVSDRTISEHYLKWLKTNNY